MRPASAAIAAALMAMRRNVLAAACPAMLLDGGEAVVNAKSPAHRASPRPQGSANPRSTSFPDNEGVRPRRRGEGRSFRGGDDKKGSVVFRGDQGRG